MGVVIPVGYGQITVVLACAGAPANVVWTHGFRDLGVVPVPQLAASVWLSALNAAGRPYLPANYGTQYTLVRVDATIMDATGPLLGSQPSGVVGTMVAEAVPVNSAILIQKATSRGGRRGRGRMFIPPAHVAEGNIGPSGTIAAAQLAAVQALFAAAHADLFTSDYPPYLLHDFSEVAPDIVNSWTTQSKLASQRTRMRK